VASVSGRLPVKGRTSGLNVGRSGDGLVKAFAEGGIGLKKIVQIWVFAVLLGRKPRRVTGQILSLATDTGNFLLAGFMLYSPAPRYELFYICAVFVLTTSSGTRSLHIATWKFRFSPALEKIET
jgi:hypothetical protein